MRALITTASKHRSTAEIAEEIGRVLRDHGLEVEVLSPDRVDAVDEFAAVVVGSAVYAGHWLEPALTFVERFGSKLAVRDVFLFSSGPIGDPPKPAEDPVDVAEVMAVTKARSHRVFAGKLDRARLGFGERAIVAALRAQYGDYRDWDEIRAWAGEIAGALSEVGKDKL
jgi:menaquinone-dependent protoporphyrinogen oxidase